MQERVHIDSAGLKLSAVLHLPEGHQPGQKHPAIIVVHGFGANKDAGNVTVPTSLYVQWGYIALRVDMRGCGESEGTPGHVLCTDQVEDVRNAISYLAQRPEVMADRIALSGTSFGGAVVLYTAGVDTRVAAVISAGGWGNGERKLEGQHPTPGAWDKFKRMLQEGREQKAKTGTTMMVHRFDIVPIPPHLRGGLPATASHRRGSQLRQSPPGPKWLRAGFVREQCRHHYSSNPNGVSFVPGKFQHHLVSNPNGVGCGRGAEKGIQKHTKLHYHGGFGKFPCPLPGEDFGPPSPPTTPLIVTHNQHG
jgi:dienelactone hydrolase